MTKAVDSYPPGSDNGAAARHASGDAPGKAILFGEHAVVYGQPAIAVPLMQVRAQAAIQARPPGSGIQIVAADLPGPNTDRVGYSYFLEDAEPDDPLRRSIELSLAAFGQTSPLDFSITVTSSIPIGRGLGSGAAVATAVVRALAAFAGFDPDSQQVSDIVYEVEKLHHGTPSGIDNTVIAFEQPVFFVRGQPPVLLCLGRRLSLVIGDAGPARPTKEVVGYVRERYRSQPERYGALFAAVGELVNAARRCLESGDLAVIGRLMNQNHRRLVEMGVSSPMLDRLVQTAVDAGALGAKMSGAGWGGSMVALVETQTIEPVSAALRQAGARGILTTDMG